MMMRLQNVAKGISGLLLATSSLALATAAHAQDAPAEEDQEIVVTGFRASLGRRDRRRGYREIPGSEPGGIASAHPWHLDPA
jgi:hypothetical protein